MLVKKNRGFTLIEIVVSLCILTIILTAMLSSETLALNFKGKQDKKDKALMAIETTSSVMLNNLTYEEILVFFGNNVRYIKSENINNDSYKHSNILDLTTLDLDGNYPFMSINIIKDSVDEVLKIILNYKINSNQGDNLTYVFYKGKY